MTAHQPPSASPHDIQRAVNLASGGEQGGPGEAARAWEHAAQWHRTAVIEHAANELMIVKIERLEAELRDAREDVDAIRIRTAGGETVRQSDWNELNRRLEQEEARNARLNPLKKAAEAYASARSSALAAIDAENAAGGMARTEGRWAALQEAAKVRVAACVACDRAAEALFLAAAPSAPETPEGAPQK